MLAGRPAGRSPPIAYQLHGSLCWERPPCGSGVTQPKPTSSHRTLPQEQSRLLPAKETSLIRNMRSIGHKKGQRRTLERKPRTWRRRADPGINKISTLLEWRGATLVLLTHDRRNRVNQTTNPQRARPGKGKGQGADRQTDRPTGYADDIHQRWRKNGRLPPANQPPVGRMSLTTRQRARKGPPMFLPAAPCGGFIFVRPGCRFVSAQIACALPSGGCLQKAWDGPSNRGMRRYICSPWRVPIFLFSLTLFLSTRQELLPRVPPNQIVEEATVPLGAPAVSQPCLAAEPSRQREKARQVPRIDPTEKTTKR